MTSSGMRASRSMRSGSTFSTRKARRRSRNASPFSMAAGSCLGCGWMRSSLKSPRNSPLPKLGSFQSRSRASSATCRASLSLTSVAMCVVLLCGGREGAWHALHAVDEGGALEHLGLAGLDVGQPLQQLAEDRAQLGAGQRRAETVVRAPAAEADVVIGIARDVEAPRVLEGVGVAVARVVEEDDLLALADRLAVKLDVARGRAPEGQYRRGPADELLDGGVDVLGHERALVAVQRELAHGVRRGVARGVVAGH